MSDDEDNESEKDQSPEEEGEEEALGRSFIADTPDEDPRFETTGTNTSDGDEEGSDGSEKSSSNSDT